MLRSRKTGEKKRVEDKLHFMNQTEETGKRRRKNRDTEERRSRKKKERKMAFTEPGTFYQKV